MPAVSGSTTQASSSVDTPAQLASVPSGQFKRGDLAFVKFLADGVTPLDELYVLVPDSAATPDNVTIIAAANGGNWILASLFVNGLGGIISVATTAALAAYGGGPAALLAAGVKPGIVAFVQSQKSYYTLSSAGAWSRTYSDAASWLTQSTFYVGNAGLPDNTGLSAGSPVLFSELTARLYGGGDRAKVGSVITINFIDAIYTGSVSFHATILPGGQIVLQGSRTTVAGGASAFTAFAARSAAANLPNRGTDATQNWAANVGNLIVDTQAGPNFGACAFVMKLNAANVGRLSSFLLFTPTGNLFAPTEVTPGATDSYAIQTITSITGVIDIDVDGEFQLIAGQGKFIVDSINFATTTGLGSGGVQVRGPLAYLSNCIISMAAAFNTSGIFGYVNVLMTFASSAGVWVIQNINTDGSQSVYGGGSLGILTLQGGLLLTMRMGHLVQGAPINVGSDSYIQMQDVGVFDFPAGGAVNVFERSGVSFFAAAALWGSSATAGSFPFSCKSSSTILNESGGTWALATPITANLATIALDLSTTAAPVSATTWANLAVQNITIANLDLATGAAGFGGRVTNNRGGSSLDRNDVV